ncbi:hypothetical protein CLV30_13811 [Haloactinopolyspora alba]|uniref:Excreted virulence factor EspC (Type VII ESX diderm) n=1 Tax=Haloactinopolyspora alba TaxID=648780 RepID=A0A2P8D097_9ACTN|nr:hypothetical protein [Haloactinopolyspora alba]PSK90586.1 hypothetical protein CLV30_13811 [Haloactinopolyspora alba]
MTTTNPDGAVGEAQDELEDHIHELDAMLAVWSHRDSHRGRTATWDRPHPRRAASLAIDEIDASIRTLHTMRAALIAQAREYDDETNRRVDLRLSTGGAS